MTYTAESDHKGSPNEDLCSPPGSGDPFSLAEHGNRQKTNYPIMVIFVISTVGKKVLTGFCPLCTINYHDFIYCC